MGTETGLELGMEWNGTTELRVVFYDVVSSECESVCYLQRPQLTS